MIIDNIIIGGLQAHQSVKTDGICTCLTSAMGMGGGYIPMILEYDDDLIESKEKVIVLGNYMPSNYDSARVVDIKGIAPCVKENHGTVTAVMIYEEE